MSNNLDYKQKYLEYKIKYINEKKYIQTGGMEAMVTTTANVDFPKTVSDLESIVDEEPQMGSISSDLKGYYNSNVRHLIQTGPWKVILSLAERIYNAGVKLNSSGISINELNNNKTGIVMSCLLAADMTPKSKAVGRMAATAVPVQMAAMTPFATGDRRMDAAVPGVAYTSSLRPSIQLSARLATPDELRSPTSFAVRAHATAANAQIMDPSLTIARTITNPDEQKAFIENFEASFQKNHGDLAGITADMNELYEGSPYQRYIDYSAIEQFDSWFKEQHDAASVQLVRTQGALDALKQATVHFKQGPDGSPIPVLVRPHNAATTATATDYKPFADLSPFQEIPRSPTAAVDAGYASLQTQLDGSASDAGGHGGTSKSSQRSGVKATADKLIMPQRLTIARKITNPADQEIFIRDFRESFDTNNGDLQGITRDLTSRYRLLTQEAIVEFYSWFQSQQATAVQSASVGAHTAAAEISDEVKIQIIDEIIQQAFAQHDEHNTSFNYTNSYTLPETSEVNIDVYDFITMDQSDNSIKLAKYLQLFEG